MIVGCSRRGILVGFLAISLLAGCAGMEGRSSTGPAASPTAVPLSLQVESCTVATSGSDTFLKIKLSDAALGPLSGHARLAVSRVTQPAGVVWSNGPGGLEAAAFGQLSLPEGALWLQLKSHSVPDEISLGQTMLLLPGEAKIKADTPDELVGQTLRDGRFGSATIASVSQTADSNTRVTLTLSTPNIPGVNLAAVGPQGLTLQSQGGQSTSSFALPANNSPSYLFSIHGEGPTTLLGTGWIYLLPGGISITGAAEACPAK